MYTYIHTHILQSMYRLITIYVCVLLNHLGKLSHQPLYEGETDRLSLGTPVMQFIVNTPLFLSTGTLVPLPQFFCIYLFIYVN